MKAKRIFMHSLTLASAMLVVVLIWPVSLMADFQAGLNAANRGDYATAYREWLPLAEQGDARAQYELGILYGDGEGVTQNDAEAVKWFRRAGEQGYGLAQYALGMSYYLGEGVPQDYVQAYAWFNLARWHANISDTKLMATIHVSFCTEHLTPAQIKEAQKLSRKLLERIESRQ